MREKNYEQVKAMIQNHKWNEDHIYLQKAPTLLAPRKRAPSGFTISEVIDMILDHLEVKIEELPPATVPKARLVSTRTEGGKNG